MIRWTRFDSFIFLVGLIVVYGALLVSVGGVLWLLALGVKSLFA